MENKRKDLKDQDRTPDVTGMEYLLIPQSGDKEIITGNIERLSLKSKSELVEEYNRQVQIGIVGVRGQSLKIFALGHVLKKVFGKTPVSFKDNMILGLTGKIKLIDEDYEYISLQAPGHEY